jgi:hypothetical protein
MKPFKTPVSLFVVLSIGLIAAGCSTGSTKSPEVADTVRKDLDQAHLSDVSVSQDREKGVVTLNGHVGSDADKLQAETIRKKKRRKRSPKMNYISTVSGRQSNGLSSVGMTALMRVPFSSEVISRSPRKFWMRSRMPFKPTPDAQEEAI